MRNISIKLTPEQVRELLEEHKREWHSEESKLLDSYLKTFRSQEYKTAIVLHTPTAMFILKDISKQTMHKARK